MAIELQTLGQQLCLDLLSGLSFKQSVEEISVFGGINGFQAAHLGKVFEIHCLSIEVNDFSSENTYYPNFF